MVMKPLFFGVIIFSLLLNITYADKTEPGIFASQAVGVSYNPLGLLIDSKLLYTAGLFRPTGF